MIKNDSFLETIMRDDPVIIAGMRREPVILKASMRKEPVILIISFVILIIAGYAVYTIVGTGNAGTLNAVPGIFTVDFDGTLVDNSYTGAGVQVINVESDPDFISLILEVEVTGSPGILEITFDRNFFDATFQGSDDEFVVIADRYEQDFEETETTSESRTLRIELPEGTDEVEIIGRLA